MDRFSIPGTAVLAVVIAILCTLPVESAEAQFIRLGWDDALGGGMNNADACEPTAQPSVLIGAFFCPVGITAVHRMEATIDFCTLPSDLPAWWGGAGSETCVPVEFDVSADFTAGPFTAQDYWGGQAEAVMTFEPNFDNNPVRARVVVTVEIDPALAPVVDPHELYYAFKLIIDGSQATCEGCRTPACFVVNGITLDTPEGQIRRYGDYGDMYASWIFPNEGCPFIVPTTSTSFGALKARFD